MKIKISVKDKILCAKHRYGHFEGVLGVINEFLKIVKAKYIFLGEKDFQQLFLIKKFIKNKYKIKVISGKNIRDNNFLPYSSRNILLNNTNIIIASKISKKIIKFHYLVKKNFNNLNKLINIKKQIVDQGVKIDYLEVRNKYNLSKNINKKNFKIFIAYKINKIRLIDNV